MFCFTTTLTILKDFAKWFSEVLVDVSKRPPDFVTQKIRIL